MTPKVGIERNNHLVFFRYIKERDEWVAELRVASRVVSSPEGSFRFGGCIFLFLFLFPSSNLVPLELSRIFTY